MESFTGVGNAAPPMPTMPASPTRLRMASGSALRQSGMGVSGSAGASSPSASMTTHGSWVPAGPRQKSSALTFPEVGEWMFEETKLAAWPMSCPRLTVSPAFTTGVAGAPMCMASGTVYCGSNGAETIATPLETFASRGWTPP